MKQSEIHIPLLSLFQGSAVIKAVNWLKDILNDTKYDSSGSPYRQQE